MSVPLFILMILAVVALILFIVIVAQFIVTYIRVARLTSKLHAIPEPLQPFWKRFTSGHGHFRCLYKSPREESAALFNAWRRKYGDVYLVRGFFGEPVVVLMSGTAISRIASAECSKKYKKSQAMRKGYSSLIGNRSLLLIEDDAHSRLRRVIAPAFHYKSLLSISNIFIRHAQSLTDKLLAPEVSSERIPEIVHDHSFTLLVNACFGDRVLPLKTMNQLRADYFACMQEPDSHALRRAILQKIFSFLPYQWFGFCEDIRRSIKKTLTSFICGASGKYLQQDTTNISAGRMSNPNLLYLVSKATAGQLFSSEETVSLVMTFLAAGQATTSFGVLWMLYNLAAHPEWQTRARTELSNWDCKSEQALEELDKLPILDRLVKETLRHDPPINFLGREVLADDVVDGFKIPRGVIVRFPIFAIQRNPDIWGSDVDLFNPDRWLRDDVRKLHPYLAVFWHGSRGCIGQRFAMLEIKSFSAVILKSASLSIHQNDPKPTAKGLLGNPINMKVYLKPLAS